MAENESWVNQPQNTWPPGGQSIIPPGGGGQGFVTVNRQTDTPPPPPPPTTTAPPIIFSAVITPIDDCMRSIPVSGGAAGQGSQNQFTLFVNGTQQATGSAYSVLQSGDKFEFYGELQATGCLKIGDQIQTSITVGGVTSKLSDPVTVESHEKYSVTTQHYNNARTGWYPYETELTPQNVFHVKEQFKMVVDQTTQGRNMIYAQPLYLHHQFFPRVGNAGEAHNAVYVATENDSVFAFNPDDPGPNKQGAILWERSARSKNPLLPPGLTSVDDDTLIPQSDIKPPIGISSTPVIDCGCNCDCENCGCGSSNGGKTPTIYIVSKSQRGTKDTATFHFYLHALDATTGDDRANSPVEITGQIDGADYTVVKTSGDAFVGTSPVVFNPQKQNCRPGLLLTNCTLYIAFAAHQDSDPYHGWVFSYDAKTLKQQNIYCTTPDAIPIPGSTTTPKESLKSRGGIWQSGMGLASDGCSIYCTTGNGAFNADSGGNDYGTAVIKLSQDLRLLSWFSPSNQSDDNDPNVDADLGSGGVLVLPDQQGSSIPLLVTAGKDGQIFLLNRNNLGGFDSTGTLGTNNNSVETILIRDATMNNPAVKNTGENLSNPGLWGSPAYYNGPLGPVIFYCMNGSITGGTNVNGVPELVGFQLQNNQLIRTLQDNVTTDTFPGGGSIPVVSSNQGIGGIVWLVLRTDSGPNSYPAGPNNLTLCAFDATDFSTLHSTLLPLSQGGMLSPQLLNDRTSFGTCPGLAFVEPTVINGMVFVPCDGHVSVFF